jgi:hypothetical protein
MDFDTQIQIDELVPVDFDDLDALWGEEDYDY